MDLEKVRKDFEEADKLRLQADATEEQHRREIEVFAAESLVRKCKEAGIQFDQVGDPRMSMDESHYYTVYVSAIYNHDDYQAIDKLAIEVEEEIGIPNIGVFSMRDLSKR